MTLVTTAIPMKNVEAKSNVESIYKTPAACVLIRKVLRLRFIKLIILCKGDFELGSALLSQWFRRWSIKPWVVSL